mmetsp:Transcript_4296/g.4298  ORF Transcript_4296/g.4298 Transcript_4296/m.4298 type:complete len:199 (-) Transcript_4296:35-631(-)
MSKKNRKQSTIGGEDNNNNNQSIQINRIKILSMGYGGSGKSCLVKRYCEERFISKYIATIGVDYGVKPVDIDGMNIRVNFWDLSGHQEFFEIRNEFYKDAQGILLVYDVSIRESFESLDNWIAEATKFGANIRSIPVVLCANKIDKRRLVTEEEGRQYAQSKNFTYFETSASSGANVNEAFEFIFRSVIRGLSNGTQV